MSVKPNHSKVATEAFIELRDWNEFTAAVTAKVEDRRRKVVHCFTGQIERRQDFVVVPHAFRDIKAGGFEGDVWNGQINGGAKKTAYSLCTYGISLPAAARLPLLLMMTCISECPHFVTGPHRPQN